jgi:hypothetical protein
LDDSIGSWTLFFAEPSKRPWIKWRQSTGDSAAMADRLAALKNKFLKKTPQEPSIVPKSAPLAPVKSQTAIETSANLRRPSEGSLPPSKRPSVVTELKAGIPLGRTQRQTSFNNATQKESNSVAAPKEPHPINTFNEEIEELKQFLIQNFGQDYLKHTSSGVNKFSKKEFEEMKAFIAQHKIDAS